jgi:hypothetical protein
MLLQMLECPEAPKERNGLSNLEESSNCPGVLEVLDHGDGKGRCG